MIALQFAIRNDFLEYNINNALVFSFLISLLFFYYLFFLHGFKTFYHILSYYIISIIVDILPLFFITTEFAFLITS